MSELPVDGARDLQDYARSVWSGPPATLPEIPVFAGVVLGDVSPAARGVIEGGYPPDARREAGRELANLVVSSRRWIGDLGLDLTECLESAARCQAEYGRRGSEEGRS
jgi:hypothetical protein